MTEITWKECKNKVLRMLLVQLSAYALLIAAAAVTLGMPPAELLDDTLYDIVNNDDTNTGADKGASLVAALTSTLLARHIAGRCNPLKTKGSCRITMMATGAEAYPQRESNSRCQIESLVS